MSDFEDVLKQWQLDSRAVREQMYRAVTGDLSNKWTPTSE